MAAFGVLLVIGAIDLLVTHSSNLPDVVIFLELGLAIGSVVGGIYVFRGGWSKGNSGLNVLAVLPTAVLIVLIATGGLVRATQAHAPTDRFGYSAFEEASFVKGCGGGSRCECLWTAVESQVPHDEFVRENQLYMRTGSLSPEMIAKVQKITQESGCI